MPQRHIQFTIIILTLSIALEITFLAGIITVSAALYHCLHMLFMASLIGSQLALFFSSKGAPQRNTALWFATGTSLTAVGDFINSAISPVQPVSLKLTWALALFGAGYAIYNAVLWQYNNRLLKRSDTPFAKYRYLLALPVLAVNVLSWCQHVQGNLQGLGLLRYGSFVFNATIYVLMPTLGLWFFYNRRKSTSGLMVLLGTLLIPYSDLILFGSWLRGGNPAAPSFQLYAYNWILYYAGQVLISLFPAIVMEANIAGKAETAQNS